VCVNVQLDIYHQQGYSRDVQTYMSTVMYSQPTRWSLFENKSDNVARSTQAVLSWLVGRHHCQMAADQVVDVSMPHQPQMQTPRCYWPPYHASWRPQTAGSHNTVHTNLLVSRYTTSSNSATKCLFTTWQSCINTNWSYQYWRYWLTWNGICIWDLWMFLQAGCRC